MTREEIDKCVERFLHEIGEHTQSARVFLTYPTEDGKPHYAGYTNGCGNFFAQKGQITDWVIRQEEYVREDARRQSDDDED